MKKSWEFTGVCAKMFLNSSRKLLSSQMSGKGPIKTYHAVEDLKRDGFDILTIRQALSQVPLRPIRISNTIQCES